MRFVWSFTQPYDWDYDEDEFYHPDGTFDGITKHIYDEVGPYEVMITVYDFGQSWNHAYYTVYVSVDSDNDDGDDLPDGWEEHYFGDLSQDWDDNSDGDEFINLCEYLHGTNPDSSESTPSDNIIIRVPADASTIQRAIDAAIDGDEIWVTAGTYKPTDDNDRTKSFELKSGVAVYGGFAGTETRRNQRDWENNVTTLSGDISGDNSYHVVTGADNAVLDGFIIKNGVADHASIEQYQCGAGIYNESVSPTVNNCKFTQNDAYYGGGMYNYNCSPTVASSTFNDNYAVYYGGGIFNLSCSTAPVIINCIFSENVAYFYDDPYYYGCGGGIANYNSVVSVTNCTLFDNYAGAYGGGMFNDYDSAGTVTDCIFWNNAVLFSGNGPEIALLNSSNNSTLTVSYSDVEGGEESIYVAAGCTLTWGSGNIDVDPLFADAANDDFHLKSVDGRWDPDDPEAVDGWVTDIVTSPCINGGDPSSSYSNEPTPNGSRINMGAYGNTQYASKIQLYQITINLTATDGEPLVDNPAWYITYESGGNYYYYDGVARYSGNQVSLAAGTYYAYCEDTETDCQAPDISDCEFVVGDGQPSSYDMTYTAWGSLRVTLTPSTARWRQVEDTTWYSSGYSKDLTAYGDNNPIYCIEFEPHLGYDTPSVLPGIRIYRGQETTKNVEYPILTRYVGYNSGKDYYDGMSTLTPWRTIKRAIHGVDEGGGGRLHFAGAHYTETLQASDFFDLNYMTNCYTTQPGYVLIKASQSVFPSSHVTFGPGFSFDQQ